jgi:3-phenylpropionate/trans-cinnamate dioxygenase ferredoxin reductase subunit
MSSETFVVIGAGQAGAWIARTLRTEGFDGRVVLIGEEVHWPYERPPLSKAFLQGAADAESMTLLGAAQAEAARIECWCGTRVVAIDRARRRVRCMDGREIGYDKLFLATGGRVRTLPGLQGLRSDRIHTLRTQADALRLRSVLTVGSSLLVIGGGWIGLEVAATVRGMGCAVTVLEAAPRLCARTMPETVSDFLLRLHQSHGVIVRTGIGVTGLSEQESGVIATVDTGELLRADHVLIAIGIVPDTTLAVNCGLPVANGIVVDAQGRTADPDIFAAGDVACGHSDFAGAALRLESWANAQNQAIVAAKAALGRADRYDEIPWFWSDQYNINLQMLGLPDRGSKIVTRGAPEAGNGCWLMLRENGTAAGAVAVNAPRELRTLRKLFADERLPVLSAWADTAVPLQRLPTAPSLHAGASPKRPEVTERDPQRRTISRTGTETLPTSLGNTQRLRSTYHSWKEQSLV